MSGDNEPADLEVLDRYRRASDAAPSQPSDVVREAILAEGRRAAARNTAPSAHQFDTKAPAANQPRWRYAAIGTACAAALAAFLVVPRFLVQPREQAVVVQNYPRAAESVPLAPAPEAMPAQAAPAPKSEEVPSMAPPPAVAQNSHPLEPYRRSAPETPAPRAKISSDALVADAAQNLPSAFAEATTAGRPSGSDALARERKSAAADPKSMTSRLSSDLRQITVAPEPAPQPNAVGGAVADQAIAQPAAPPQPSALLAQRADATRTAGEGESNLSEIVVTQAKAAKRPPTPLISAINWGRAEKAQALLESGEGSTTETDAKGRTPLLRAVEQRRLDLVQLLLAHGADPNAADEAGETPLSFARQEKLTDIVALLEAAAKASP
jgi:hypothetical protein